MAKHARKKQKQSELQPLGSNPLTDDALKDDEERKLEAMLFGTKFVPREVTAVEDTNHGTGVLSNLMDSDLFFVDDGALPEEDQSDDQGGPDSDSAESSSSKIKSPLAQKSRKPPAWTDPSDPPAVSLSAPRLRKLRDAPDENVLSGREYEARLRRQYERINPEPLWARQARSKARAERDDDDEGLDGLLASTEGILRKRDQRKKGVSLKPGTIDMERLRDANLISQGSAGEVRVVAFHPSEKVPVLCVASADRRVRLFNIDGHTNPLLQTLHLPSLPLTSSTSASFHPLGSSLLLTGPRPFFYTHDLQSGVTTQHTRGLWGTTFNDTGNYSSRKRTRDGSEHGTSGESMELTAFSPHTGDMLAVAGKGGNVHLVDWKSGAGQVVGSLKCSGGGGVSGLWWVPGLSEGQVETRKELVVLTSDAEVYLWDVGTRRCVRRWKDEGGFRGAGRVLAGSGRGAAGGFLAVGSNTGFVNVYDHSSFSPSQDANPKPLKSIGNLTTSISGVRFNHDAQLMAVASQNAKDGMRLIHTPSLTSYANWPTSGTPLGHVTALDFSPRSEYLAIGNTRGRVLLYGLREYGAGV